MREGVFVAVVGPSGAGKDSLLSGAAKALAVRTDISFVRRVVTRVPDRRSEDHDTLSVEAFQAAKARGAFCLSWSAHGLCYGVPMSALESVRQGCVVVANISRSALADTVRVFGSAMLIEVSAARDVLAERLKARERETPADVERRLQRAAVFDIPAGLRRHVVIDNSTTLENGISEMIAAIAGAASPDAGAPRGVSAGIR